MFSFLISWRFNIPSFNFEDFTIRSIAFVSILIFLPIPPIPPIPPMLFAILANISDISAPPVDSFILPRRSPASFIISSREISPLFIFASNLPVTDFIKPIILVGFFISFFITSWGLAFSALSPSKSVKSPEISSAISLASEPILPLNNVCKCSCIFSILGILFILNGIDCSCSDEPSLSELSFLPISLKKSVRPSIVSPNFACKSFSSIPSNMFIESPNVLLSLTLPTTVNKTNCKYFQIVLRIFSVTPSEL